jgi:LAS superfamily LD-carboxypeptidase LdcB
MVRTQIQLTEEQANALRAMSAARQLSMAELIRISIDRFVTREAWPGRDAIVASAKRAVGRFSSGSADGSSAHDKHLADAFEAHRPPAAAPKKRGTRAS